MKSNHLGDAVSREDTKLLIFILKQCAGTPPKD